MSITNTLGNLITGGSGNIGAYNRSKELWKGRAKSKRLAARIDALESNQKTLLKQTTQPGRYGAAQGGQTAAPMSLEQKQILSNPLQIDNINVVQVYAGDSKKDIQHAKNVTYKNTKLLEQFVKSTKAMEKNTKRIRDQDTRIKKQTYKDRAKDNLSSLKAKSKSGLLKGAKKTGGVIATIMDWMKENWGTLTLAALASAAGIGIYAMGKIWKGLVGGFKMATRGLTRQLLKPWEKIQAWKNWELNAKMSFIKPTGTMFKINLRLLRLEADMDDMYGGGRRNKNGKRVKGGGRAGSRNIRPSTHINGAAGARSAAAAASRRATAGVIAGGAVRVAGGAIAGLASIAAPIIITVAGASLAYDLLARDLLVDLVGESNLSLFEKNVKDMATSGTKAAINRVFGEGTASRLAMAAGTGVSWAADVLGKVTKAGGNVIKNFILDVNDDPNYEKAKSNSKQAKLNSSKKQRALDKITPRLDNIVFNILPKSMKSQKSLTAGKEQKKLRREMLKLYMEYNKKAREGGLPPYEGHIWEESSSMWSSEDTDNKVATLKLEWFERQLVMAYKENPDKASKERSRQVESGKKHSKTTSVKPSVLSQTQSAATSGVSSVATTLKSYYATQGGFALGGGSEAGLTPKAWPDLKVDVNYRKVIDHFEAGGDYNKKVNSGTVHGSTAFGRYQFTADTAKRYAKKIKVDYANGDWKQPVNQDKMFQVFTNDNKKIIEKAGVNVDVLSLWIAHNLGPGAIKFMYGKTKEKPSKQIMNGLQNNTNSKSSDFAQLKNIYLDKYTKAISKILGTNIVSSGSLMAAAASLTMGKSLSFTDAKILNIITGGRLGSVMSAFGIESIDTGSGGGVTSKYERFSGTGSEADMLFKEGVSLDNMELATVRRLKALATDWRVNTGNKITITDAYRATQGNGAAKSMHLVGKAVDIRWRNWSQAVKEQFIIMAGRHGFTGYGIGVGIIHIDTGKTRTWKYDSAGNWRSGCPAWALNAVTQAQGEGSAIAKANPNGNPGVPKSPSGGTPTAVMGDKLAGAGVPAALATTDQIANVAAKKVEENAAKANAKVASNDTRGSTLDDGRVIKVT